MSDRNRGFFAKTALIAVAALFLSPFGALAQSTAAPATSSQSTTSASKDRWLHVRVISSDAKGETVRVNVPLELAEKVLPAINKDRLHGGKVRIDDAHVNDVDLRALVDAIRTSKDGEFVTVQSNDCDVRVAKLNNHLIVHVLDKQNSKKSEVEVKVPMKVIDALFSAGKDELDLVAALHALSAQGDTELVSVKDHENTVRVWLDSKNVTD
jgi:WD40 repeat protein